MKFRELIEVFSVAYNDQLLEAMTPDEARRPVLNYHRTHGSVAASA